MTKPTIIAVMGHLTLSINNTLNYPAANPPLTAEYGWGIYRDVDISSSTTDLPAYSAGYSNSWMVHKTGSLSAPGSVTTITAGAAGIITLGDTNLSYRRYDLNLRRYKRVMDSANDTLILSVENNSGLAPAPNRASFALAFYFRMLLLE